MRRLIAVPLLAAMLALPGAAAAQDITPQQKTEIEKIIREYLIKNPQVLQEAIAELEKRQAEAEQVKRAQAVTELRTEIFSSPRQAAIGNPAGDLTLVEFFDYNCGFCKRALADKDSLLKGDGKLKIVLKELPVLGPGSVEAARVSVAARMQDPGAKFAAFHDKLLGTRGPVAKDRAMQVAKEVGYDMARIERDLESPEVAATIQEGLKLADALGITGTPSYVVGDEVVIGAVGAETLKAKLDAVRKCGKAVC